MCLGARLVYIQGVKHTYYDHLAVKQREQKIDLPATRGTIYDCNNNPLATNLPVGDITADPTQISDPAATCSAISAVYPAFDEAKAESSITQAKSRFTHNKKPIQYVLLAKTVPQEFVDAINRKKRAELHVHHRQPGVSAVLGGSGLPNG